MEFNFLEKGFNRNSSNKGVSSFIKELAKFIHNISKNNISLNLSDSAIYVIRDINDVKLSLVNIYDGKDFDVYAASSPKDVEILNNKGIFNDIYEISKDDLYTLDLGKAVTVNNNKLMLYSKEIKIENPEALAKLDDMFFCLEQEKNAIYSVTEITDEKIFLTDVNEGGYFSIPKEKYPNFQLGDLLKKVNGLYVLKDSLS